MLLDEILVHIFHIVGLLFWRNLTAKFTGRLVFTLFSDSSEQRYFENFVANYLPLFEMFSFQNQN